MIENFDYRNVSFYDLYLEFANKFPGKPDFLFKALAKHFDQLYWYNEVSERNAVGLLNAVTDEARLDGLYMLNYYPQEVSPVGASILIEVDSLYPVTIYKNELIFDVTVAGKSYKYYATTDIVCESKYTSVPVFEGSPFDINLGVTVEDSPYQRFLIPFKKVIWNLVEVDIDGTPYIRKYHLMDSLASDKHFRNYHKDGYQQIEFGDNTYGAIPIAGVLHVTGFTCGGESARATSEKTAVTDTFISVGGSSQDFELSVIDCQKYNIRLFLDADEVNVEWSFSRNALTGLPIITVYDLAVGSLTIKYYKTDAAVCSYSGSSTLITAVHVESNFTGGAEAEDLYKALVMAPKRLEVSNRLATENDTYVLSKIFSSDILEVKTLPFYYGIGTIGVHVIPKGGGAASAYLMDTLSMYLNSPDRRYMDNNTVMVDVALYTIFDFVFRIKMIPGYSFKEYMELSKMAIYLFIGENYSEYQNILLTSGTQAVRDTLNTKLNLSLPASRAGELLQIFELLKRSNRSVWANRVTLDTLVTAIRSLLGISQVIIDSPNVTIETAWDRASTVGTMVCTEIV